MCSNSRIAELTEQLQSTEDKGRVEREALLDHLHGLTTESTAAKLENQSLKVNHPAKNSLYSEHNPVIKFSPVIHSKTLFICNSVNSR